MPKNGAVRDEHRRWLRALAAEIFDPKLSTSTTNMDGAKHVIRWNDVKRRLSDRELVRLKSLAKHFVIRPASTRFGFNFGICFFTRPSKKEGTPEYVFSIDGSWLPERFCGTFEDAWKELSPLSHNKENRKLLKRYKFSDVQSKEFYEY